MVATLVNGLSERGHTVTLVAAGSDRTGARFEPTFDATPDGLGGPDTMAIEVVHAQLANDRLRDLDVDLIHDHSAIGPLFAPYRAGPTVMSVHGPVVGWMRKLYRVLRNVALVAISDAQRASAPELPWQGTVHNGIDVDSFPLRENKDGYLAFLGRMNPDKGIPEAIQVARRVERRLLIAAKCSDPQEITYYEEVIEPLLGDHAEYVGDLAGDEKGEFLAAASALVFPIQWEEPFGLVMVEAMACGTPVLATRRGSVPEVVEDGLTGFVCDDVDQIVRQFAHLGDLSPRRIRERARERFNSERMIAGYEAVYRSVLAERNMR